jgi:hypothetical protein
MHPPLTFRSVFAFGSLLLCTSTALKADPPWWMERQVVKVLPGSTELVPPNDFAAVTQGQIKRLATAAFDEMQLRFALYGGAGPEVTALVRGWHQANGAGEVSLDPALRVPNVTAATRDFATATVRQLKSVATPFQTRLIELSLAAGYPWSMAGPADFAMVNIGQVKALFSFDPALDSDADGVTDADEINYYHTDPRNPDTNGDGIFDGDQIHSFDPAFGNDPAHNLANKPNDVIPPPPATQTNYTYDRLGRLRNSGVRTYTYDEEGNVTSVQ